MGQIRSAAQIEIVGDEAAFARILHPLLDHRMAGSNSFKHRFLGQHGPHVAAQRGEMREVGQQIGLGDARTMRRMLPAASSTLRAKFRKDALLDLDGAVVRGENLDARTLSAPAW